MTRFIALSVLALAMLGMITTNVTAGPGIADGAAPIKVGKSGGKQSERTEITGTTASQPAAAKGKLNMQLKNTTDKAVSDLHICIKQIKYPGKNWKNVDDTAPEKIDSVQTAAIDGEDMPNHTTEDNCVTVKCDAGKTLKKDEQLSITVRVKNEDTGQYVEAEVKLEAHWTIDDIEVCATSTDDIGSDRPVTSLASVVDSYDPSTAEGVAETNVVTCNDICLAERDGYRFQNGSIVLTPDNSTSFAIDVNTEIVVFDEDSNEITTENDRVDITNLRIDDRGNFVFNISREAGGSDEKHIVLVIRGLMVSGLSNHEVGEEVRGSVSGAGVSGYCMHNLYTLVRIVAGE
jgi:hypothetical protein